MSERCTTVARRLRWQIGYQTAPLTAALGIHTRRTWLLWLVGVVVLGTLMRFDPALAVYLLDPEFVAGWLLFLAYYLRHSPGLVGATVRRAVVRTTADLRLVRTCLSMEFRWAALVRNWRVG